MGLKSGIFLTIAGLFFLSGCAAPTPLIKASLEGRTEEVRDMLEKGADINERGTLPNATKYAPKYFIKSTPLMAAAHYGQDDTVNFLVSRGADINAENFMCMSAIHLATVSSKKDTVSLLIKKGAKVNPENASSGFCYIFSTPLLMAAYNGDTEIVKLLVKGGANIDAVSYCGYSPLLLAAQEGRYETVKYLVKNGANPNLKSLDKLNFCLL